MVLGGDRIDDCEILRAGKTPADGRTAVVLSGGNTDAAAFAEVITSRD